MTTIEEKIRLRHAKSGYVCERCGEPSTEIAHGISKGKAGRKTVWLTWVELFGEDLNKNKLDKVIHHDFNTFPSCSKCNDYFNIHISQSVIIEELLRRIHEDLNSKAE